MSENAEHKANLFLQIENQIYRVSSIRDGEQALGWRLSKADNVTTYELIDRGGIWNCNCPSYEFGNRFCKHLVVANQVGLINHMHHALPTLNMPEY